MPRCPEVCRCACCPQHDTRHHPLRANMKAATAVFLRLFPFALCLLLVMHSSFTRIQAQSATATLSGTVLDQNGAVVPGVNIAVISIGQGFRRTTTTGDDGGFVVPLLPPGSYIVKAERDGFGTYETSNIVLNVNDQKMLRISLKIGSISQTVLVDGASLLDESPAVVTTVDRPLVENMPLNGRSFQSLMTLSPGVVLTKAGGAELGQFSVNGQRADANYFTIDGVSANIGVLAANVGQPTGGSLPGFSVSGGTNNLVSIDALQEFKIQTSTYAAEFGRQPGAQVQVATRSGTNEFHGTLFNYFRNDIFDANNWFNNARRLAKPATRQNDFGAVLGGPILLPRFGEGGSALSYDGRRRSFFFFSYEGLRLRQPQAASTDVPTLTSRQNASAGLRPFLSVFPLPNGPNRLNPVTGLPNGYAQFNASFSIPSSLNATSVRIDHLVSNKLTLFARYNHAPSETISRGIAGSLSVITPNKAKTQTLTVGATSPVSPNLSNDFRFNWSRNSGKSSFDLDGFGGSAIPGDSLLLPSFTSSQDAQLNFLLLDALSTGSTFIYGRLVDNLQRQINIVDSVSSVAGKHQLKFGVDYRRLSPVIAPRTYGLDVIFANISQTVTGIATSVGVRSEVASREPSFTNLSLYGQDTWKVNDRLTLTYGLRWELNPPPSEKNGNDAATVQGLENPATASLGPLGTPLYPTTYNNFAPRIGVAYRLRETIFRGGFGIFYDLGSGTTGAAFLAGQFPYTARKPTLVSTLFPLTSAQAAPPTVNLTSPTAIDVTVFDSDFKLPKSYQWNFAIERPLGPNQSASVAYVGAAGRRLLRQERLLTPNATFNSITITRNTATSDYHGLQLQFRRRLSRGLQGLASYSWAKSLDNVSFDSSVGIPGTKIDPQRDRGPSDFDVRHAFNTAVIYAIPHPSAGKFGNAILGNWSIDTIFTARSATPVNVIIRRNIGFGTFDFRPDLIPGIPLYLDDPAAPGGKRFNKTRIPGNTRQVGPFFVPAENRQGSLGRNVLRGFSIYQLDFALSRNFNLKEKLDLRFKTEVFNIFNHPNFADPIGSLGTTLPTNPQFGLSDRTFGASLGSGGTGGGFNPLYQIGGPRSIQLCLKIQF